MTNFKKVSYPKFLQLSKNESVIDILRGDNTKITLELFMSKLQKLIETVSINVIRYSIKKKN